jgi:hypothetical protein
MLFLKYFLSLIGFGLLIGAASILVYDLYQIFRPRGTKKQPPLSLADPLPAPEHLDERSRPFVLRWRMAGQIAAIGLFPLVLGLSIAVIPASHAGVRINQYWGTPPGTLSLSVGLAVTVRFKFDPGKPPYNYSNLPRRTTARRSGSPDGAKRPYVSWEASWPANWLATVSS